MKLRNVLFYFVVLVVLALGSGCATSPYLKAAGEYGTALQDGVSAIKSDMADIDPQLCGQRAWLDYLKSRFDQTYTRETDRKLPWTDAMKLPALVNGKETASKATWGEYCGDRTKAQRVITKALGVLSAYGEALKTVSTKGYPGSDMGSLVSDAKSGAESLSVDSNVTKVAGAVPGPLKTLADAIAMNYAEHEVQRITKESRGSVTKILWSIKTYLEAVEDEAEQTRRDLFNYLKMADSGSVHAYPVVLQLFDFVTRWDADIKVKEDKLQNLIQMVGKLEKADKDLEKAGKKDDPDSSPELDAVSENALGVIYGTKGAR